MAADAGFAPWFCAAGGKSAGPPRGTGFFRGDGERCLNRWSFQRVLLDQPEVLRARIPANEIRFSPFSALLRGEPFLSVGLQRSEKTELRPEAVRPGVSGVLSDWPCPNVRPALRTTRFSDSYPKHYGFSFSKTEFFLKALDRDQTRS